MDLNRLLVLLSLLAVGGCSHIPNADVGYYLTRTDVNVAVVRTVTCDANNHVLVANAATPTVLHSADTSQRKVVPLASMAGVFRDADLKFEYFEDGRLKGLNGTSTGQGESILKTAAAVVGAMAPFGMVKKDDSAAAEKEKEPRKVVPHPTECAFIKKAGDDKPITLTYQRRIELAAAPSSPVDIPPDVGSRYYASRLAKVLDGVQVRFGSPQEQPVPVKGTLRGDGYMMPARHPALLRLTVETLCPDCRPEVIWDGRIPVAHLGTEYEIPLPAARFFGKQATVLGFSESGALTNLQYGTSGGAGEVLNAVTNGLTTYQGRTSAEAAQVKAEADLIAQQQRLLKCRTAPDTCTPE